MLKAQLPPGQEVMPLDTVAYCAAGAVAQVSGLEGCVVCIEHFARWGSLQSFPALRSALRKATHMYTPVKVSSHGRLSYKRFLLSAAVVATHSRSHLTVTHPHDATSAHTFALSHKRRLASV